jgi:hypothetical protein
MKAEPQMPVTATDLPMTEIRVPSSPPPPRSAPAPHPEAPELGTLWGRMARVYRICRRTHSLYVAPLVVFVAFSGLRAVVWLFMQLDGVFFPELRRTRVERPIVLVGNPRTGTTFLQRFLVDRGFGAGMDLFLMLYPSLVLQRVLRPFMPLLERISPARYHSTDAHQTSLSSVETDDVAVLFRHLDGFFLYGFFLSFDEPDLLPCFDPKVRDTSSRDFAWLDAIWRRSLVLERGARSGSGKAHRNVAKLFSLSPRLPQFLKHFPDAQILYMVRDPLAVIPSSMSLVTGVLERAFGFWKLPTEVRQRWLDRMYQAWVILLSRFHDDWQSGAIDKSRVFLVHYDRMMENFEETMSEMCTFLDHPISTELWLEIAECGSEQRRYQSAHRYDLAKFGLSEAKIRQDCAFYYETFMTKDAGPQDAGPQDAGPQDAGPQDAGPQGRSK